ncbi:hypothetical protein [Microbacterium sp.]|uniref:hypothetical protein n=1 Tax=Microbacterium sp. TaxID=51671 RepID=UPI003F702639
MIESPPPSAPRVVVVRRASAPARRIPNDWWLIPAGAALACITFLGFLSSSGTFTGN